VETEKLHVANSQPACIVSFCLDKSSVIADNDIHGRTETPSSSPLYKQLLLTFSKEAVNGIILRMVII